MGSWGTGISSNDTYADIYSEFFNLYNDGLDVDEISKKLVINNPEIINDSEDSNNFWFALAKAQWECKQLDKNLFDRVKTIIESGADLDVWRQLEANEKDIKKREAVLNKFLEDLKKERPKAKKRKEKVIHQPIFEKGDCLTYKLKNENYGGAIVLEAIKNNEYGQNLIVTTRINQPNKPSKQDFENAEVLIINYGNWASRPIIHWYLPIKHNQVVNLIEKVDNINIQVEFEYNDSTYGIIADFNSWIIEVADEQFQYEETNEGPIVKQTIKSLTKKNRRWKFWD